MAKEELVTTLMKWERRPVSVSGVRGLFHGWSAKTGRAMIEFEDGSIKSIESKDFIFMDSATIFKDYSWSDKK